jgi:hypothetical protein
MHVSCVKISSISKQTETSIHLSLITEDYHMVRSKQFLRLRYIWRKPCTNLTPILTLSPNWPKWDSTWPRSPRCSVGYVQSNFWAWGTFSANRAPIIL